MAIATSTNKLKVTELDFEDIKTALKEYLSGQSEFTDYNFESSGMGVLLDLLAYNTHYNAFYTNMVASEMFLDSAGIRSNVVSKAKMLGYMPSSRNGAEAIVDITISGITTGASQITIPKGYRVTSRLSGSSYIFLTTESHFATPSSSGSTTYVAKNVNVREGVALTYTKVAVGSDNELFTIPNENVDIRSLEVLVNGEKYNFADDFTDITSTSKIYFLQEGDDERYQVYFGDGVVGLNINPGDTVFIGYAISRIGIEGNGARIFAAAETLSGTTPTIALSDSNSPGSGGTSRESVSSIKLKAPRGFETQKRAVTAQDYKTRLVNDYPSIDAIKVWGGEENDPPDYGKVFVTIKVKDGYALSDAEKLNIKNNILKRRNVVTITPEFIDPEFMFLVLNVNVNYDPRATTKSKVQLQTDVVTTVTGFSITDLNKFDSYFRHSNLLKKIDETSVAIKNCAAGVGIRKEVIPTLNSSYDYTIKFRNRLYHPHQGHRSILTSTKFNHSGYGDCRLDDVDGVVRVVTVDPITGDEVIVNRRAGSIDYETGKVFLEGFTPTAITDETTKISITVVPKDTNVVPFENTIISILDDDLTINMIDDTEIIKENSPNY